MRKITLFVVVLLSIEGSVLGDTLSKEALNCRALTESVRPPGEEDAERASQYFDDADRAYRDCRGSKQPFDVRVNALLMYGMASDIRGRSQAAITAYKEALGLVDRGEADKRVMLIEVLDQAASVESRAGARGDATAHSKQALDERVKQYGLNSAEVSAGMLNLAMVLATFGEYEQSEKLLHEAVRVADKVCGRPECRALASAYSGMQTFYELVGKKVEAQKYAQLAQDATPPTRASGSKE